MLRIFVHNILDMWMWVLSFSHLIIAFDRDASLGSKAYFLFLYHIQWWILKETKGTIKEDVSTCIDMVMWSILSAWTCFLMMLRFQDSIVRADSIVHRVVVMRSLFLGFFRLAHFGASIYLNTFIERTEQFSHKGAALRHLFALTSRWNRGWVSRCKGQVSHKKWRLCWWVRLLLSFWVRWSNLPQVFMQLEVCNVPRATAEPCPGKYEPGNEQDQEAGLQRHLPQRILLVWILICLWCSI